MSRPFELPPRIPLSEQRGQTATKLVELMQRLLAPDGCPWDREQNPETLRQYVIEEACEVVDAVEAGDPNLLQEELGDLLLQVVFLGELMRSEGQFGPDDVVWGICEKLVRRHPHVFGNAEASDADAVVTAWEQLKQLEKGQRPLLDTIPRSLPALLRAYKTSTKVARVGFDWHRVEDSRAKVQEELAELEQAIESEGQARVEEEFGDLLFALVNWGRHLGLNAEDALRKANDKFRDRFEHVESRVREKHGDWPRDEKAKPTTGLPLEELEGYWEEAKRRTVASTENGK